jgi:outer membrane protein OmpA-like peptidoglycan-associated protein
MIDHFSSQDSRHVRRRKVAGLGRLVAVSAAILVAGCSSLDPTGLLDSDVESPESVDAGQSAEGGSYPNLAEVPEAPARRPSDREAREALHESLTADRQNARYSDEDLRSPEAAPDTQTPSSAEKADEGAAASDSDSSSGDIASAEDAQEMPEVPAAPSETVGAQTDAGDAVTANAETPDAETADSGTPDGGMAAQVGDAPAAEAPDTAAETPAAPTESEAANGAVTVNPSQVPQITPSRGGEPIQLPSEVQQYIGSQAGDARQTAALRSPPLRTGEASVAPDSAAAAGERVAVIYFPHAGADLRADDREVLRRVAEIYRENDGGLRIVGHASSRTATMDMITHRMVNLDVSMKRAENVADALVRFGVPRDRIQVEARSDRDPQYHEVMPTGEAGNRRAEIFLTN